MKIIDLHSHTTKSDGSDSPAQLVQRAKNSQVSALAITDHDTVQAIPEAFLTASRIGQVEIISGIEISAYHPIGEIHFLGYFLDVYDPYLQTSLKLLANIRHQRNQKMINQFARIGIPISLQELQKLAKGPVITRPHFAKLLMQNNIVASYQDAFQKYLSPQSGLCYVPKSLLNSKKVISIIKKAGGIAILAHPGLILPQFKESKESKESKKNLRSLLVEIQSYGLDGLEVFHSEHSFFMSQYFFELAVELNLLITGGSDYHGQCKPHIELGTGPGHLKIPYHYLQQLRNFYLQTYPHDSA